MCRLCLSLTGAFRTPTPEGQPASQTPQCHSARAQTEISHPGKLKLDGHLQRKGRLFSSCLLLPLSLSLSLVNHPREYAPAVDSRGSIHCQAATAAAPTSRPDLVLYTIALGISPVYALGIADFLDSCRLQPLSMGRSQSTTPSTPLFCLRGLIPQKTKALRSLRRTTRPITHRPLQQASMSSPSHR